MRRRVLSNALCLFVAICILATAGCGGKSVDFSVWAGSYSGSAVLDNNKTATLSLVSDSTGLATGTLVVTGADGTDTNFKFTAGTYNVSGSVTSTGGGFEVDGTVPNNGNFVIRGTFPTDSSPKVFHVVTSITATFT